eukprot:jgi/Galph1/733/GphlegSOOS_G5453.1
MLLLKPIKQFSGVSLAIPWVQFSSCTEKRVLSCVKETQDTFEQHEPSSLSRFIQETSKQPSHFSMKKLGKMLEQHLLQRQPISEQLFRSMLKLFPSWQQELRRSYDFLGRIEYCSFFLAICEHLNKRMVPVALGETNPHEVLDLFLKNRREQMRLLEFPKIIREREANGLWQCSLVLSDCKVEGVPANRVKVSKEDVLSKTVFKIFSQFVENIENDMYSRRTNFDSQEFLKSIVRKQQPKREELMLVHKLKKRLQSTIRNVYADSRLEIFGSAATGLWKSSSDIDFVIVPNTVNTKKTPNNAAYLRKVANYLRRVGMQSITLIGKARVPIVKFVDPVTGFAGDISWGSTFGVVNSRLIKRYLEMNALAKDFVWLVKYWASCRGLVGAQKNYPSSYCWVLICLWFLQRVANIIPVIPIPKEVSKRFNPDWIQNFAYEDRCSSNHSLTFLLEHFFRYFAYEIHPNTVITVSQQPHSSDNVSNQYKWKVEDPLEFGRDLTNPISDIHFQTMTYEFLRAHKIFVSEGDFLKIYQSPRGESIRQRMTDTFDCLLVVI